MSDARPVEGPVGPLVHVCARVFHGRVVQHLRQRDAGRTYADMMWQGPWRHLMGWRHPMRQRARFRANTTNQAQHPDEISNEQGHAVILNTLNLKP